MVANTAAAFSRGDLVREIRQLKDRVKVLETRRDLESASIGAGGLRVLDGFIVILDAQGDEQMRLSTDGLSMEGLLSVLGDILVTGGGDISVADGGLFAALDGSQIRAFYADDSIAVMWGSLIAIATGDPDGHGLLVQDDEAGSSRDIFRAKRDVDGTKQVFVGEFTSGVEHPVDSFITESLDTRIRSYGGLDAFLTTFDGGSSIVAASDGGDAQMNVLDTGGAVRLANEDFTVITAYEGTGNAANCHLTVEGQIMRSTSSRRVKQDIRDAEIDTDAVLRLRPRTWLPSDERHGYAGAPPEKLTNGASEGRVASTRKPAAQRARSQTRQVGFVAEELDEIGLGQFVEHDENGQAGGIAYDRLTAALVTLCQSQQQQIDSLTERVSRLDGDATNGAQGTNRP